MSENCQTNELLNNIKFCTNSTYHTLNHVQHDFKFTETILSIILSKIVNLLANLHEKIDKLERIGVLEKTEKRKYFYFF